MKDRFYYNYDPDEDAYAVIERSSGYDVIIGYSDSLYDATSLVVRLNQLWNNQK